jgi:hypothetical protein
VKVKKRKPEHLSVNDWSEKECYLFSRGVLPLKSYQNNKVIRKVAKTQGSHLEFGKNWGMVSRNKGKNYKGEIQKCTDFSAFLSFSLSFSGFSAINKFLPQPFQTSPCPFNHCFYFMT